MYDTEAYTTACPALISAYTSPHATSKNANATEKTAVGTQSIHSGNHVSPEKCKNDPTLESNAHATRRPMRERIGATAHERATSQAATKPTTLNAMEAIREAKGALKRTLPDPSRNKMLPHRVHRASANARPRCDVSFAPSCILCPPLSASITDVAKILAGQTL